MYLRPLALGLLAATVVSAEDIPRAVPVVEPPVVVEPPEPLKAQGQDRVISSTRQFRISGGEPADRGNIAVLSEEAKSELLRLTEEKDDPKVPVTIALHGKTGDPLPPRTVAMDILVSETGYEIHMDVHLSRGIDHESFKFAATTALIYERALRDRSPKDASIPFQVPPWLVTGLREATAWRLNQSDRRLYEALFKTGGLFKTDDLFAVGDREFEDMDGAMRAAFRVSSGSLVMALLQQPQGKGAFRAFLTEVAAFQGEMPALLRKHFPELNLSETSLSKWWALQLANIGGQNLATDILTISDTEAALGEGLRLNFRTPEGILQQKPITEWAATSALPEPERFNSVRLAQDALVRLSYRCFPSYRPMIAEYQLILGDIAKNKTKEVASRLVSLDERRTTMTAKAQIARDYMDWFEITRARETSGAFDDYMRLKERLKSNPHQRTDEFSKYLDRMDAIFSRGLDPNAQPPVDAPFPGGTNMEMPELPPIDLPPP